jgi:DNA polymerase
MSNAGERREALKELLLEARVCTRCAELAATRTSVVFGAGNADADLMFVGEAPGANEDLQGLPFVGAAGKLLETLLGEIGLSRAEVFIANVLKCRPPGNRDPRPGEIENCTPYLVRQVELVQPRVICTLGNFATKLLRDDPAGITRVHGRAEVRTIGAHTVRLFPIYHPAAALYTPRTLESLREDFHALPGVLALPPAPAPEPLEPVPEVEPQQSPAPAAVAAAEAPDPQQLGLF